MEDDSFDYEPDGLSVSGNIVELCDYCGRTLGIFTVTVAGKGKWCSRDCRNAHAARDYAAKQRRTA